MVCFLHGKFFLSLGKTGFPLGKTGFPLGMTGFPLGMAGFPLGMAGFDHDSSGMSALYISKTDCHRNFCHGMHYDHTGHNCYVLCKKKIIIMLRRYKMLYLI